ncbi:MAG: hypothetical protein WC455_04855 [Dehalococcoidia bacterium]
MKRYAVLGMIIALVVSIAAIGCSSGSSNHESTPTATHAVSTPTTEATSEPTEEPNEAALATSLDFTIQVDSQGAVYTYQYRARNIGTNLLDIRVDMTSAQVNAAYIVSGSSQQAWLYSDGQWIDMSQSFNTYWDTWSESFEGYQTYLAEEWTGLQGWTYDIPGDGSVTYTNIDINPSLPDSIFQPD